MTPPPLIHVGYHKTGTTWLQTGLFVDGASGFGRPWDTKAIRDTFVLADPFDFDPLQARATFESILSADSEPHLVPVLSDERLSGSPHAGGFDAATIASRLSAVFPEARVLLVFREQVDVIHSIYKQYVRDGGVARLSAYLRPRNPAEIPQFRFAHFEYHRPIQRYRELFGEDRVLALPFETLVRSEREFVGEIVAFCGLPSVRAHRRGERYPSLGSTTLAIKRWINAFLVRNSLSPAAPFYVKDHQRRFENLDRFVPRYLSRRRDRRERSLITEAVVDRYVESNRQTARLTGRDLAALGYRVS